jgi:hypothetical protein
VVNVMLFCSHSFLNFDHIDALLWTCARQSFHVDGSTRRVEVVSWAVDELICFKGTTPVSSNASRSAQLRSVCSFVPDKDPPSPAASSVGSWSAVLSTIPPGNTQLDAANFKFWPRLMRRTSKWLRLWCCRRMMREADNLCRIGILITCGDCVWFSLGQCGRLCSALLLQHCFNLMVAVQEVS